ncbi:transposase [Pseudomonas sp. DP16D-R1]|uniref:transposase n=1 Tax=Pseudomonas sp. DP16D-R1 TaxID=2075551 RepID=UPI0035318180
MVKPIEGRRTTPFVAPVSLSKDGHPLRAKLSPVSGFSFTAIKHWANSCLATGSCVYSDGLARFGAITAAGCKHEQTVFVGRKLKSCPSSNESIPFSATSKRV